MTTEQALTLLVLAVAVGTASVTLTHSQVTARWRGRLVGRPYMIGELANCPYCVAHWLGALAALLVARSLAEFVVLALAITGLSALFMGVVLKLFLFRERELEDAWALLAEARAVIRQVHEEVS